MEKSYVNATEVAQFLHVSRATVYNLVRKGLLPCGLKIGNNRRWDFQEIKKWVKRYELQH